MQLLTKEQMSMFVVKSIVIEMNGLGYGSINALPNKTWNIHKGNLEVILRLFVNVSK